MLESRGFQQPSTSRPGSLPESGRIRGAALGRDESVVAVPSASGISRPGAVLRYKSVDFSIADIQRGR